MVRTHLKRILVDERRLPKSDMAASDVAACGMEVAL